MTIVVLRALRDSVEAAVLDESVEPTLATGTYRYLSSLLRLVEDGDRDGVQALREGNAALAFLLTVPRLPAVRARAWRQP